jgi:hypothetical protein
VLVDEGVVAIGASGTSGSSPIEIRGRRNRFDRRFCMDEGVAKARSTGRIFPASAIARRSAGEIFFFRLFAVAEPPAPSSGCAAPRFHRRDPPRSRSCIRLSVRGKKTGNYTPEPAFSGVSSIS